MRHPLLFIALLLSVAFLTFSPMAQANTPSAKTINKEKSAQKKKKSKLKSTPQQDSPSTLTKTKKSAEKEISRNKQKIAENDKNIRRCINDINSLTTDIELSRKKVAEIGLSIKSLDEQISTYETEIAQRQQKINTLKHDYLTAIKKMRLKKGDKSAIAFIFSSKSVNQALRRLRYLREFAQWRERHTQQLRQEVDQLSAKQHLLQATKEEKQLALGHENNAKNNLLSQQEKKQSLVAQLQRDNTALNTHIRKKQQEIATLNARIAQAIEADRQRQLQKQKQQQQLEERRKTAAAAKPTIKEKKSEKEKNVLPAQKATNASSNTSQNYAEARQRKPRASEPAEATTVSGFASMKGRLPRPVAGAFKIITPYGRHTRPGMGNVEYDNTGIDIETSRGAQAKAIYEGTVAGTYKADGFSHIVLVKHGAYYTVYANLGNVAVHTGQNIKQGQNIGSVATDGDKSILHFEIWKERSRINPSEWIN